MIGLEEIRRCDEHPDVDFSDEKEVMRFVRPDEAGPSSTSPDTARFASTCVLPRSPSPLSAAARLDRPSIRFAPPLAALDRARLAARVSNADVRGENPRQFPRTAVLFPRRSTTPGWDARARDAN